MNHEQLERIKFMRDKMIDRYLLECDPDNFTGKPGELPKERDQATRGNLGWDVKNANGFALLTARSMELAQRYAWALAEEINPTQPANLFPSNFGLPPDPEAEMKRFENEAVKALARAQERKRTA